MTRLPLAARGPVLLALVGACGAGLWALASCGSNSLSPVNAGGDATLTDATRPLSDAARDAASDTANLDEGDATLGCDFHKGWQQAHPFPPTCTMQVAPPPLWPSVALPIQPCSNGQANCIDILIPKRANRGLADFAVQPVGSEADAFFLRYYGNTAEEQCRTSLLITPTSTDYRLSGAIEMNTGGGCQAIPESGNSEVIISQSMSEQPPRTARVALSDWSSFSPRVDVGLSARFANSFRSGNTIFAFDSVMAQVDIVDISGNALLRSVHYPITISQWDAQFATHDELWGSAGYGALGKLEVWRVDRTGTFTAMLQKKGVHIFAPQTDGTTLFWAEGSGNDADFYPQPKLEIWTAPFSSDPAIVAQGARRLLDVSGVGEVRFGTVHHGYYAANLGVSEILVIRASDGAFQRIPLLGGWGRIEFGYVDEQQVWFGHGAANPAQAGVSRIQLQPWP